jgi:Uma2 family endonuclease
MSAVRVVLTYDDYVASPDDGRRYEIHDGVLSVAPAPSVDGAPTLVIEILSPWTARRDRQTKKQLFARYGVPSYWIVDPDSRAIEAYRADAGAHGPADRRTVDLGDLAPFPGLTIDPAELWR